MRDAGTVAQQYPATRRRLSVANGGASGQAKAVLDTLLAWNGHYDQTAPDGTVDPGVATWDAFRVQAAKIATAPFGAAAALLADEGSLQSTLPGYDQGTSYHLFDATHEESYGLRTLDADGYRRAAAAAFTTMIFARAPARPGHSPRRRRRRRSCRQESGRVSASPAD